MDPFAGPEASFGETVVNNPDPRVALSITREIPP